MEELLSDEARRIIATPFPEKEQLIHRASDQVNAEVTMEMQRRLNAKFPEYRAVTDALAALLLDDVPDAPI